MPKRASPTQLHELLRTWASLNAGLMDLAETEVHSALQQELKTRNRPAWVRRLYHRWSMLRRLREVRELEKRTNAKFETRDRLRRR